MDPARSSARFALATHPSARHPRLTSRRPAPEAAATRNMSHGRLRRDRQQVEGEHPGEGQTADPRRRGAVVRGSWQGSTTQSVNTHSDRSVPVSHVIAPVGALWASGPVCCGERGPSKHRAHQASSRSRPSDRSITAGPQGLIGVRRAPIFPRPAPRRRAVSRAPPGHRQTSPRTRPGHRSLPARRADHLSGEWARRARRAPEWRLRGAIRLGTGKAKDRSRPAQDGPKHPEKGSTP